MRPGSDTTVGVLGCGRIGAAIGRRLIRAGYQLLVYDVDAVATRLLAASGARPLGSPTDLAAASVVFVCVGYGDQVRAVLSGRRGLIAAMRPDGVIAVVSTVAPALMTELTALVSKGAIADTPVTGGEAAAERGELVGYIGAEPGIAERLRPLLMSFCRAQWHVGPVGSGQIAKALNNYLLWVATCANHQVSEISAANGLDFHALRRALGDGSGWNRALELWDEPRRMAWAEKDLAIVSDLIRKAHLRPELVEAITIGITEVKESRGLVMNPAPISSPPALTEAAPPSVPTG